VDEKRKKDDDKPVNDKITASIHCLSCVRLSKKNALHESKAGTPIGRQSE